MDKAFIFDRSGTLNNNLHSFHQISELIFRDLGKEPISKEEVRLNYDAPYMKFWNKYFPDLTREKQCEMFERYTHQVDEAEVYPGVVETLTLLHEKWWRLFILSSDPVSKLIPEIEKSGLFPLFTKIIGEVHEKNEILASLVEEFHLDKKATFYVGDVIWEVEAGKFAGVKTIAITWWFQHRNVLSKANPDYLIDDIVEIKNII